jgi:hypothetical protein
MGLGLLCRDADRGQLAGGIVVMAAVAAHVWQSNRLRISAAAAE